MGGRADQTPMCSGVFGGSCALARFVRRFAFQPPMTPISMKTIIFQKIITILEACWDILRGIWKSFWIIYPLGLLEWQSVRYDGPMVRRPCGKCGGCAEVRRLCGVTRAGAVAASKRCGLFSLS